MTGEVYLHNPDAERRERRNGPSLLPFGLSVLLAVFLLASPAFSQTPPGTEIVNVASCTYPPGPPDNGASPVLVLSNAVRTMVTAAGCFDVGPGIAVAPGGTVPPGERLTYTVNATVSDQPATLATITLPFDPGLQDPISFTDGSAPLAGGGSLPVSASWDAVGRILTWSIPNAGAGDRILLEVVADVRPDLPADSTVRMAARADADGCTAPIDGPVVVTSVVPPVLLLQKRVDRATAAPGDAVGYTVEVTHSGAEPVLTAVSVADLLPPGMRYMPGTARRDDVAIADPSISDDGSRLQFSLGPLAPGESTNLRYAAVVAPGARRGEALNRARATALTAGGASIESPIGSAIVTIVPGPFRSESMLMGRVFVDDDLNGLPDEGEPGIPGVLVVMEDGRGAVTDITGRWHIDGVPPGLHVLRLDPATLNPELLVKDAGIEWAGSRKSRFIETRAAGLIVADFPLAPARLARCRVEAGESAIDLPAPILLENGGLSDAARVHLDAIAAWLSARGKASDGGLTATCGTPTDGMQPHPALLDNLRVLLADHDSQGDWSLTPEAEEITPAEKPRTMRNADGVSLESPFQQILRTAPRRTTILDPPDGTRTGRAHVDVDVLYRLGTSPELSVNGVRISEARIGVSSTLPSRGLAAARFVGVPLQRGENILEMSSGVDGEMASATVTLPGTTVGLKLRVPEGGWRADGVTPLKLWVEAVDAAGVRTAEKPIITLNLEGLEAPVTADLDPATPGHQVRLRDGRAEVLFAPLSVPGRVRVEAESGLSQNELFVDVLPAVRSWMVVGLAEGRVAGDAGVEGDGGLPPVLDDGISDDGGRLAVFARGPVGKSSRLTVSVDSERRRDRDQLFRGDVEPDQFFPVAGDDSRQTEEAPTQSEIYARIDGPRGFAQWGDFATQLERTELARYDRRMTGASGRLNAGKFSMQAFASAADQVAARDVFEPDGTSGPFLLSQQPLIANSETVIVEVRDRFRSERVLSRTTRLRDVDYDLDPIEGTLLFRSPIAPFDEDLNPVRIVVLYEVRSDAEDRLVSGARFAVNPAPGLELGASTIYEERAGDDLELSSVDLSWRPAPGVTIRGEVARSELDTSEDAVSFSASGRTGPELAWEVSYQDLPASFQNPTLLGSPELGSKRAGAAINWEPGESWRLLGEAYSQEDERADVERDVIAVDAEKQVGEVAILAGAKHVSSESPSQGAVDSTLAKLGVRGRIAPRLTAELTRDQLIGGDTAIGFPSRTSAGLAYELFEGQRVFLRHEIESGDGADRDRTVIGVEGRIGAHTKAQNRYSLEDSVDGYALRSLTGVETVLPLSTRAAARFSVARQDTMDGDDAEDFTTVAGGYEYRAGSSLFAGRYELRHGTRDDRHLLTGSGAFRPADAWTVFVRERLFLTDPEGGESSRRAEGLFGVAYRPDRDRFRFLFRLDHATGSGSPITAGGITPGGVLSEPAGSAQPSPSPTGTRASGPPPAGTPRWCCETAGRCRSPAVRG